MASARHIDEFTFITTEQLTRDTLELAKVLPPDIDIVVGISRSGLLPGSLVAYFRHLPLYAVSRQTGVTDPGHGGRMEGHDRPEPQHVLLVDDTAAFGREMTACAPIVAGRFPGAKITRAVVYCRPEAVGVVDVIHAVYPGSHYLSWNFACAGHGQGAVFDHDGILNRDFTAEECADDATYLEVMARIEPLYLPRRTPVPLVVTARPEWSRDVTNAWLAKWGVRVERLVMWPGKTHPPSSEVAPWKARHYAESPYQLFVESDPWQAETIADLTRKAVLCPMAGKVFPAKPPDRPSVQVAMAEARSLTRRMNACPHRGCQTGCGIATCAKGRGVGGLAGRMDCAACPDLPPEPTE